MGDFGLARELLKQATDLAPNESEVLVYRAYELGYLGEFDAAIEVAASGRRMNPFCPDTYLDATAMAYFLMGRYQDALRFWAQVSEPMPECMAWEVAAFAYLGDEKAAQRKSAEFLREYAAIWAGDPSAGPKDYVRWITQVSNPFARDEDRERLVEGLRLAGLPG